MFYPIKLYTYLNYRVNLAVDSIQHDRFIYERTVAGRLEDDSCQNKPARGVKTTDANKWSNTLRTFLDDMIWMLEYNHLNLFDLFQFCFINSILIINSAVAVCFILRPKDRDPQTGQYLDPYMRFFETIYWADTASKSNDTGSLHKLLLVMCIPFIMRRFESLLSKFKNAKLNRHKYVKLDTIQLNIAQIDQMAMKSVWSYVLFILSCGRHRNCDRKHALRGPNGNQIKAQASELIRSCKIDWLYFRNLISFEGCYREASKYMVLPFNECDSHYNPANLNYPSYKPMAERLRALCKFNSCRTANCFVAKPYHRFHPRDVLVLSLIYVFVVFALLFIIPSNTIVYYYPVMQANGLDSDNILATIVGSFINSIRDPASLIELIQLVLYVISLAVHLSDTASLVHNAVVESSRAKLVTDMLNVEIDFYTGHLEQFSSFLIENNLTINGLTNWTQYDNSGSSSEDFYANYFSSTELASNSGGGSSQNQLSDGFILHEVGAEADLLLQVTGRQYRHRNVDKLIRDFKTSSVDQAQVLEFNENIRYLLTLIRVLQNEQKDLRDHFTWSLNLSVFAGTFGLSIAWTLFNDSQTIHDVLIVFVPTVSIFLPIAFSLFMGATSEGSFRRITKTIRPLMINELRLVDRDIVKDLQSIYAHLSLMENRSFMILGNLPLTFGSLAPVSRNETSHSSRK